MIKKRKKEKYHGIRDALDETLPSEIVCRPNFWSPTVMLKSSIITLRA